MKYALKNRHIRSFPPPLPRFSGFDAEYSWGNFRAFFFGTLVLIQQQYADNFRETTFNRKVHLFPDYAILYQNDSVRTLSTLTSDVFPPDFSFFANIRIP